MYRRWGIARWVKLMFLRFIRLEGTPHEVSKGVALGIFIGMTPTFGFQMIIALFFAWLLRESKVAAVLGVWVTNPVTAPVIYALQYETGRFLLDMQRVTLPSEFSFQTLGHLGWEVLAPLCLGSLVWAILGWLVAYSICLRLGPVAKRIKVARWPRKRRV
ncbi:MAG: DUF2062 domain-containing protein [Desulfuromonas sp.]|nr:MAG: DUF2062 domain-containing protein [Desulfuromonas sp.]